MFKDFFLFEYSEPRIWKISLFRLSDKLFFIIPFTDKKVEFVIYNEVPKASQSIETAIFKSILFFNILLHVPMFLPDSEK